MHDRSEQMIMLTTLRSWCSLIPWPWRNLGIQFFFLYTTWERSSDFCGIPFAGRSDKWTLQTWAIALEEYLYASRGLLTVFLFSTGPRSTIKKNEKFGFIIFILFLFIITKKKVYTVCTGQFVKRGLSLAEKLFITRS